MMDTFTSLGGPIASNAAAASWGSEETQVFAVREDGALWNRYWDGEAWHAWESLEGDLVGQPAASARGADRIDVMAIGGDGALQHRWWDGQRWVPWEPVAGAPEDASDVACSWIGDRLDVFVRTGSGELWYAALSA